MEKPKKEKVILGIDPGTTVMGYGLIRIQGKEMSLISMGAIQLHKLANHPLKLKRIFERTLHLIDSYHPDEMAIEAPFYGKNVQSMLKLGRAQGVSMAAALYRDVPITEYLPKKVKQSITGSGNASKEQVAAMLNNLMKIEKAPSYLDATDGLAVAVCHHFQGDRPQMGKNYSDWGAFIKDNPGRKIG